MEKGIAVERESQITQESCNALEMLARTGAQRMLQVAIEAEGCDYIEIHRHLNDGKKQLVVRNGLMTESGLQS